MRIMKILPVATVLLLLGRAPALPASAAPAASANTEPASATVPSFGEVLEVNVVGVDVYVTDKNGNRVSGLKQDDFVVSEDGKTVAVTNFEAVDRRPVPAAAPPERGAARPAVEGRPAGSPANPGEELFLVVFVDDLHLNPGHRDRAVEQIRKFLAGTARPGDHVLLATYGNGLKVRQAFTSDAAAIDRALGGLGRLPTYGMQEASSRQTAYQAMLTLNQVDPCSAQIIKPVESYAEQMRSEALRTLGALTLMINSLSGIPGHKALLLVSDGISITPGEELFEAAAALCNGAPATGLSTDTGTAKPGSGAGRLVEGDPKATTQDPSQYQAQQAALDAQKYSVAKQVEALAAHASANRVTFYTLQASGLQAQNMGADVDGGQQERLIDSGAILATQLANLRGSFTAMALDTGGRAMFDANDAAPELARMQEDFDSYYSLGYSPAHRGDGTVHRVDVKVKRPGLKVRYRQSYRDKPALEKLADRTLAALVHGVEENPLDVGIEIGEAAPAESGLYAVPVRLKIPLFKLAVLNQQNVYQGKLRILVATRDDDGGTSAVRQVEVPLSIPRKEVLSAMGEYYIYTLTLKLKPGRQQVAVAVRDDLAAAASYLSRPVDVGAGRITAEAHP
jgi:VWFA-related protein